MAASRLQLVIIKVIKMIVYFIHDCIYFADVFNFTSTKKITSLRVNRKVRTLAVELFSQQQQLCVK